MMAAYAVMRLALVPGGGLDLKAFDLGLEVPGIMARSERMVVVFGLEPSGCFSLCIVLSLVSAMPG